MEGTVCGTDFAGCSDYQVRAGLLHAPLIGYSYSNCVERNIDLGKIVYRNLHSQEMLLQGCLTK